MDRRIRPQLAEDIGENQSCYELRTGLSPEQRRRLDKITRLQLLADLWGDTLRAKDYIQQLEI